MGPLEAFLKTRAKSFQPIENPAFPNHRMLLWSANEVGTSIFVEMPGGDFVAVAGTFFYGDQTGQNAAHAFYSEFDPDNFNWAQTSGQFALAIVKGGQLHLMNDGLCAWNLYTNNTEGFVSAGFLEALFLTQNPSFDTQGVYEYAFAGYVLGENTFVSGIRTVLPNRLLRMGPHGNFETIRKPTPIERLDRPTLSNEDLAAWQLETLRKRFSFLRNLAPTDIASSVSGGFDSRLMLGLLAEQGFKPNLFVYGPESDPDIAPSRAIAAYYGLKLNHVDRTKVKQPSEEKWPTADDMLFYFDGWKIDGLVGFPLGIEDRHNRVAGARFMANGKCGEIYRQYYYQHIGPGGADIQRFLKSTFGRTVPQMMHKGFDDTLYQDNIEESFRALTGFTGHRMSQWELEYLYPKVRIPHDAGRDIVINHRFARNLYPFVEPMLCGPALTLNFRERQFGQLEGQILKQLDPKLAAIPSAYGYDLTEGPDAFYRAKMALSYHRPMWLRTLVPAIKQMLKPSAKGVPLQLPEMNLLPDPAMPYMRGYFKMDAASDPQILSRLVAMELLGQRFGFKG